MDRVPHGGADTTHAIRAAIQRSKVSVVQFAERYDLETTVRRRQWTEHPEHL